MDELRALVAKFSDLAVELEKHSNDHIHDALPDNLGAAVEGVCADRINAILKPYRAAQPVPAEGAQADVEELAAKSHEIYQQEAKRQGDVRHKDAYADFAGEYQRVRPRASGAAD